METVKRIEFKYELEGNGIVNYDSKDQKWAYNKIKNKVLVKHDNVNFAKKTFTSADDDGGLNYRLHISSNCVRHEIFKEEMLFQNTSLLTSDEMHLRSMANPSAFLRGYLNTSPKATLKRASPISITSAIQTNNAVSNIEVFIKSGEKEVTDEKKSNTLFFKEACGEITYGGVGFIDLMQLQFLSCDAAYDRMALLSDDIERYVNIFKQHHPSLNVNIGYYQIKNSVFNLPEYGVLFSNDDILFFVKKFFKNMLSFNIAKSGSYAKIKSISYKLIYDTVANLDDEDGGWVNIRNINDVNAIDFVSETFYTQTNPTDVDALKSELIKNSNHLDAIRKENKEKKGKTKIK